MAPTFTAFATTFRKHFSDQSWRRAEKGLHHLLEYANGLKAYYPSSTASHLSTLFSKVTEERPDILEVPFLGTDLSSNQQAIDKMQPFWFSNFSFNQIRLVS